jgi:hypothetical protein
MTNNFGSTSTGQKPTTPQQQQATLIDDLLSPVFKSSPIPKEQTTVPNYVGDIVQEFIKCFKGPMSSRLKLQVMDYMFKSTIVDFGGMHFLNYVRPVFLNICFSAMETLHKENKNNLILELCKCFERTGCKSQSRMPLDRMPFGLLDYNIRFFASDRTNKLGYEEHYASWLDTMFSQFGHKWLCLHRGPAWQYEVEDNVIEVADRNCSKSLVEKALEQSGIDLSIDDDLCATSNENWFEQSAVNSNVSFDILESSLADLTLCSDDIGLSADYSTVVDVTCMMGHSNSTESTPTFASATKQLINLPHLWTHATNDDQNELMLGNAVPTQMEKYHGVQPMKSKAVVRNPAIFDPLKVS